MAWQFLTNLTERETIDFLLYELPPIPSPSDEVSDTEQSRHRQHNGGSHQVSEEAPLLRGGGRQSSYFGTDSVSAGAITSSARSDEFSVQFENLSALEIATVSDSKKFLSQRPVQKIINGLWRVRTFSIICKHHLDCSRATSCSGSLSVSIR